MSWGGGGGWRGGGGGGWRGGGGGRDWNRGGRGGDLRASDADIDKVFDWGLLKRTLGFVLPYKKRALFGVVAMILLQTSYTLQPLLEGLAIDSAANGNQDRLILIGAVYFGVVLLAWMAMYQQTWQMSWVGQHMLYDIASAMFRHIVRLSLPFFDRNETGRIMSRVQSDVQVLQQLLDRGVLQTIGNTLSIVSIIAMMFFLNWRLAALTTSTLPVLALVLIVWQGFARRRFRQARATISVVNANLQENVSGVRVIQSLGREEQNFREFEGANSANLEANLGAGRVSAATAPMVEFVWASALALVIFFGGSMVLDGSLSVGMLFTFVRYIDRFLQPIRMLIQEYSQLQRATVAAERIFEILDTEQEIKDAPDAIALPPIEGHVSYDHVHFAYMPGIDVLKDFALEVEAGKKVAFVGQTGAGKSTIVSLLMRFYEVTGGAIRIDGHDIRDVTMESLRRQLGVVLQDAILFSGTIAENIRYARPNATYEEVVQAARSVGAAEIIERMPDGYDTIIQERGVGLSLGQRQIIAFARAMLADPRILILDEATANLDTATEQIVQRGIRELTQGRTSLIIAHRLSTIRDADVIVVVEDGRIIETGNHETLIEARGAYYRLYSLGFEQAATGAHDGASTRRNGGRRRGTATAGPGRDGPPD